MVTALDVSLGASWTSASCGHGRNKLDSWYVEDRRNKTRLSKLSRFYAYTKV